MKRILNIALAAMLAAAPVAMPAAAQGIPKGGMIERVNALRAQNGLGPVAPHRQLEKAALAHARDMSAKGYFDHTSPDGSSVGDRVKRAGYRWCSVGENIALGQTSIPEAFDAWVTSPGHRANMLGQFSQIGIARAPNNNWVMVLAAPC